MKKTIFTTLGALLFVISAFAYSGGNGSELFPYEISSKADMVELATNVNSGQAYTGKYFKLTRSLIGSTDTISTTIGNNTYSFSGIFDGSNYEVAVKINSTERTGLFGNISNGTIKNLGVSGSITSSSAANIGSICAYATGTNIITNCYSKVKINATSTSSGGYYSIAYFGGVCGYIYSGTTTITNCYNVGNITTSVYGTVYVGGICGGIPSTGANNKIENCYNTGTILAKTTNTNTDAYAGGICGSAIAATPIIKNCYNAGNISSIRSGSLVSYSGGICGQYGNIQNCFVANVQITNVNDAPLAKIGRVVGGTSGTYANNYAYGMITLNGNAISSTNANSKDGKDAVTANFQDQAWLTTNLTWDFTDTWIMPGAGEYPVLKFQEAALPPSANVTVTVNSSNAALGTTLGSGIYARNSSATIHAIPLANNVFVSWSDSNTDNPRTLTADDDITLTATFASCDNSALLAEIETLETANTNLQNDLNTANGTITTLNGTITTLNGNITTLETQNTNLQNDLNTANGTVTTLNGTITTLNGNITTLQTQNTNLQNDLNTANGTVTTLNGTIIGLENDLSDSEAEIIRLQNQLNECSTVHLAKVKSTIASIYPNPTTGIVYLNTVNNVKVYSQNGDLLQEKTGDSIDLSGYATGIYLLQVGDEWVKVVKQ